MEEDDKYLCYYLVAFIDLLGQKEELLKFTKLPNERDEHELQGFREQFKKTYGRAKALHDAFDIFLKNLYDPAKRPFSQVLFTNDIKYKRFADGIAIYLPLMQTGDNMPVEGVNGILLACAFTKISLLEQGIPLRGGIDVDLGFEIEENDIYGPCIVKAYQLESEIAKYPRIVVGDGLLKYLYSSINNFDESTWGRLNKVMAESSLELITNDSDGYPILDYMGEGFIKATNNHLKAEVFLKAYSFVENELDKWKEQRNSKLAFRYSLMLNYMKVRLDMMTKDSNNT